MNAVDPDLARLGRELRGEALLPDAEGCDGARRVFNGMIDRRPLEDRYDPENLIRLNQNVEPSGRGA